MLMKAGKCMINSPLRISNELEKPRFPQANDLELTRVEGKGVLEREN